MADITFKPGGEIIITLKKDSINEFSLSEGKRRAGLLGARKKLDYLPRRKQSVKGNLNFFDLGEYKDVSGFWIDDQKSIVPTVQQMNDVLINGNPATRFEDFLNLFLDDIRAAYNDKPVATNLADWKNAFRRLNRSDGVKLGLYLFDLTDYSQTLFNSGNSDWTETGYKVKDTQNLKNLAFGEGDFEIGDNPKSNFLAQSQMHTFSRLDDPTIKITGTADFSAVAIDPNEIVIDSQSEINYFVSRRLKFPVFYFINSGFDVDSILNYSFFAITRRNSIDSALNEIRPSGSGGLIYDALRHYARIDNARQIGINYAEDDTTESFADPIPASSIYTDFPRDADGIRLPEPDGGFIDAGSLNLPFDYAVSGCLLGAINQDDNWYFIWKS